MSELERDVDPFETKEWLESLDSLIRVEGVERAQFIIDELLSQARKDGVPVQSGVTTAYVNTIPVSAQPVYPGDHKIERRIRSAVRWNAIAMVLRSQKKDLDLGGHISTFQSAATMYEVCYNHFFKAATEKNGGDLVFFQGHAAPGMYARAYVEGRLTEEQLDNFRQEAFADGLSSYPHPKLMPEFWQFSTVSMGLGPVNAIYQARFLKYLENRGLKDTSDQKVYAFLGDGEMDEIESKGALTFAAREKLNNLIFTVSCNLQRLDGPVNGNGKIVQELEGLFTGAGWEVIKVLWGSNWDKLFAKDTSGKLAQLMMEVVDGDYLTFKSKDGAYIREHFFGRYPETAALVADMTDEEIWDLRRGAHDSEKLYAAYAKAQKSDKPVVILAHQVKGYKIPEAESKNTAHQSKKMSLESLKGFRDYFELPLTDEQVENLEYIKFAEGSEEYNYIHGQRKALNGYVPARRPKFDVEYKVPALEEFKALLEEQPRGISTTMAFTRALNILLKDKNIGKTIVPMIVDEARTFGMEGLFRQVGIYNPHGQNYTPSDRDLVAYYREAKDGQVLQEGINELGGAASWVAAATSYSVSNQPMIPFFIYYSMFGFQRVGDMMWLAGDQLARGFMVGGTSGRTTLNGEGLQHEDGHSHIQAGIIPNCITYDPSFAFEVAVIMQDGINRMYGEKQEDVFYYMTTLNEVMDQPAMPSGAEEGIRKGLYKFETVKGKGKGHVQLLGSGAIMRHVREAAQILANDYGVTSDVFSAPSFNELAREGNDAVRWNLLHPTAEQRVPYVAQVLADLPTVASTDYVKQYADQIRAFVPSKHFHVLGTDGFGRSDSRANLREHFEVDARYVVVAALSQLAKEGTVETKVVADAIAKFGLNVDRINPLYA
ncbi:pyruvate dehydrogenase (acetyl-transferring), homodimeric type [Actinobacillus equuli subsp. haemolyticus]|uniref:pyruvate dehydrogenase (acetyl-transferring), homodimeric type n=1 Tax=Actinobacillus equuli TaxID=718 RepID=UPI0024436E18|nr:pyruvate dehydrogenase (acetyl-transferring), homodimeric type [Actinobacillus equuli]WGE49245.1 pyruvate dehydrogenase (acetyl-transferring), homodimeric type [Actinobacillus equuli subsp. equuli]WGE57718.1 pyruvate dehydrogenase (acetyl-transferring), homodimeric type [Actinobacillus equuli subsp. equuli]WGE63756.1 pyruvate dehydrogenase (acetyl-transferring), homodimeric type [Actinobacillus equuli subsp. haemolyticus]WGE65961.1 pyruvate dehydrogenase (acetyl-transferring), homodimeric ty